MFLSTLISGLLVNGLAMVCAGASNEAAMSTSKEMLSPRSLSPEDISSLLEASILEVSMLKAEETLSPTSVDSILIDTASLPTEPATITLVPALDSSTPTTNLLTGPASLTATKQSLSENDSQAASITSNPNSVQTSLPPLSTQASPKEIGFSTTEQFETQILQAQNWYRAAHGADPLVWNESLADASAEWVRGCVWDLESTPGIGKSYVAVIPTSVFAIINDLGLTRQLYNWSDPGLNNATQQFTQMVWKSTTQVGCAWNNCPPGSSPDPSPPASTEVSLFLLCEYYPKGNQGTASDWRDNVGELESGTLGGGVVAASGLGLSSSTSATITSTTTSINSAATGRDTESWGNKRDHSLFAVMATSAFVVASVNIYPSTWLYLFLVFGLADGISHVVHAQTAIELVTVVPTQINTQAPPTVTGLSSPPQFQTLMLQGINWFKAKFGATNIVWDDSLAVGSELLVAQCLWNEHSVAGYGQTVYESSLELGVFNVIANWGIKALKWLSGYQNEAWDFTQMVWNSSTQLGCAWNNCPKESDPTRTNDEAWQFIVCLYYPPGDPEGFDYDKYPWTSNVGSLVSAGGTSPAWAEGYPWTFTVCEYYPKGNTGDFHDWYENVGVLSDENLYRVILGINASGVSPKSAITATATLTHHSTIPTSVGASTNIANKKGETLISVIISSVIIVGSLF